MTRFPGFLILIGVTAVVSCFGSKLDNNHNGESKFSRAPTPKKVIRKLAKSDVKIENKHLKALNYKIDDMLLATKAKGDLSSTEKNSMKAKDSKKGSFESVNQDECLCTWRLSLNLDTIWPDGCIDWTPINSGGVCLWPGITCDDNSNIVQISISQISIEGIIPSCLGDLLSLTRLKLSNDDLVGTIPSSLGKLFNLQSLYLNGNSLSGLIPSTLGKLNNLQYLVLSHNSLSGVIPSTLGQLSKLVELYMDENSLSGTIPLTLSKLTKLQYLVLSHNSLSGVIPSTFGQLSKLIELYLDENSLSGVIPPTLSKLTKLQYLVLSQNSLSGVIPSTLGQLSKLIELYLNNNDLTGSIPLSLSKLTKLEQLFLSYNSLTGIIPTYLGMITSLTTLHLDHNQFTGSIPTDFCASNGHDTWDVYVGNNAPGLCYPICVTNDGNIRIEHLHLCGTISTEQCLCTWRSTSTNLQNIWTTGCDSKYIPNNIVTGGICDASAWPGITCDGSNNIISITVTTDGVDIGGIIPSCLGDLTSLTELNLNNNNLIGSIPTTISKLSNLIELHLDNNHLIGSIPLSLSKLTKLQDLSLDNNSLKGIIPSYLGMITSLTTLHLDHNQFTGSIPTDFCASNGHDTWDVYVGGNSNLCYPICAINDGNIHKELLHQCM
eukprot:gene6692-13563_t